MIKYKVTLDNETIEFAEQALAEFFISQNGGILETINEFTGITNDEKKIIQTKLQAAAWEFINPYFDQPAFIQMTDWKASLPDTHPVQNLIASIQKWKDAVMMEYLMRKKPYMWGGYPYDYDYSFIGAPPCSFTDMFLTVNPSVYPGYTPPDVSGYTPGTR
jgi:hypothetical protein